MLLSKMNISKINILGCFFTLTGKLVTDSIVRFLNRHVWFLVCLTSGKCLQKRSLLQFSKMVGYFVRERHPTEFIGYGNYCGLGGSGVPIDAIDRWVKVSYQCDTCLHVCDSTGNILWNSTFLTFIACNLAVIA